MLVNAVSVSRTALLRASAQAALRPALVAPRAAPSSLRSFIRPSAPRLVANPQSGAPGSDSIKHAAQNIKEEAKSVRKSIESAVAGGQEDKEVPGAGDLLKDAKTITGELARSVPRPALFWGVAGVLPYISTAGASVYLARQAQLVANGLDSHIDFETASALLIHAENVQISYGAIILSFLGAIHWGFEFAKYGGELGHKRYMLGLVPVVLAWPSLAFAPQMALITQWAAYVVAWFIDLRATTEGWVPKWYSTYRFWLTAAVGTSIIATLAGTNYYDSDKSRASSVGTARKLTQQVKEQGKDQLEQVKQVASGRLGGKVRAEKLSGGDMSAESSGDEGDSYVKIRNVKKEEEEEKSRQEEEKKKQAEEQKAKKEGQDKQAGAKEGTAKENEKQSGKEGKEEGGDDK